MKSKHIRIIAVLVSAALVLVGTAALLVYHGVILLNNPSETEYPVRGVDVSSYQGEIDWGVLSAQDLDFAFIKATEGSSMVDHCFAYNFSEAQKCDISVGAYHFFSYDSPGVTQAENFIDAVTPFAGMLPPVVDLEFYGDKMKNPPDRESVARELNDMLSALEAHYGLKPVIYATEKSYDLYLSGAYEEYNIWIRNVLTEPELSDGRAWTFWQYTNRDRLPGYDGEERFIDVNVFCGSREAFQRYPRYGSGGGEAQRLP